MNKVCIIVCLGVLAWQINGYSAEDIMPMHPGAAYTAPDRSGRPMAARQDGRSQLHVNQVRLRLPSSGPAEPRLQVVEVKTSRPDGSLDFSRPQRLSDIDDMGIPGLVAPEMLAMDSAYRHHPYNEREPVAESQPVDAWTHSFDIPGMPETAHEPAARHMPPPIMPAPSLSVSPDAGRLYEETPIFYSSVPPVQVWTTSPSGLRNR